MRGEQPAVGVRIWPRGLKRSWSSYLSELIHRRELRKRERLELIELMGRERRRATRRGEFVSDRIPGRRWC